MLNCERNHVLRASRAGVALPPGGGPPFAVTLTAGVAYPKAKNGNKM